ncbi:MAG: carbon starvation protein A, partial [Paludibacteraceae bacterium]|nr:carbon starvation protein A [Paludibacteraceae bacterium]
MITFSVALVALILGYFLYGKVVERVFGPDGRVTPAVAKCDNVDFIPLKPWRIFMIQFLNIAGLGPIFGAILGAKFGTASYLWIVFGCIFAGAMHDYVAGMMSMRHDGESLPGIIGRYLGERTKKVMVFFTMVLMMLVAAVFVSGPAGLLQHLTSIPSMVWIFIIFAYYILATLLPIDEVIGKVYPIFAIALIFMAV